jgi:hypothetical protein
MHNDLEQRRTLSRLLRELPQEAAPPYSYREFRRRARHGVTSVRRISGRQLLAASVLAAVAVAALTLRLADPGAHSQPAPQNETAEALTPGTSDAPASGGDAMERLLASLPREPAVARVGDRAAVTGLEDRIAQVDDLLSAARSEHMQPARLQMLQQERTRLVGTLVQVRYAETLADASR